MKHSWKILSVLAALVVGIVAIFSFAACGNTLQTELDALKGQRDWLQDKNDQLQSRVEQLEHEYNKLRNRLEEYENPHTYTDEEVLAMFDLEEEAHVWKDNDQQFGFDLVIICFKKTSVYPKLKLENFHLSKAKRIEYVFLRPKDSNMDDLEYIERYRQMAFVHLKKKTRDAVVTTIRELEALPFIASASPNYIHSFDD